jgi:hypothetical protein
MDARGSRIRPRRRPWAAAALLLAATTSAFAQIEIQGDLVFQRLSSRLIEIFDVQDPTQPRYAGSISLGVSIGDFKPLGDRSIVAESSAGVLVISLVNPARPQLIARHFESDDLLGLAVTGDLTIVTTGQGLKILDFRSSDRGEAIAHRPDLIARAVAASGSLAIITANEDIPGYIAGVQVLDLSDPYAPEIAHSIPITRLSGAERGITGDNIFKLEQLGSWAFVHHSSGETDDIDVIDVFDLNDPQAPDRIGHLYPPGAGVARFGRFAYTTYFPGVLLNVPMDLQCIGKPTMVSSSLSKRSF